jgi:hypothetical protein
MEPEFRLHKFDNSDIDRTSAYKSRLSTPGSLTYLNKYLNKTQQFNS